jgi:glycosyltransferase involved in cell wall biosynthesis
MKFFITCKLDSFGAFGFIKPIADLEFVEKVDVFRYTAALPCMKVVYHMPALSHKKYLGQVMKLVLMLRKINRNTQLGIGIYEVPHGLLAFIVCKVKKIPVAISIIGNPAYKPVRKGLRKRITYFVLKRSNVITVTGSRSKKYLFDDGIKNVPIYILPNSIDIEHLKKMKTEKTYDILSLGRLSPEKELLILLKIIQKLKEEYNSIKCAIAGRGPEASHLQEAINQMGLESNVSLLGYVDDIVTFYNSGKIFVLTSSTEGLPRSVLEAMACGVPCVASHVGDMADAIIDGQNGCLIEQYDAVDEYVININELLSNDDKYRQFSANAESYIKKNFSYDAASRVWHEIITGIHGGSENE